MTTTANLGRAMLNLARHGGPQPILDGAAIDAMGWRPPR
jgi:hypothetical protein